MTDTNAQLSDILEIETAFQNQKNELAMASKQRLQKTKKQLQQTLLELQEKQMAARAKSGTNRGTQGDDTVTIDGVSKDAFEQKMIAEIKGILKKKSKQITEAIVASI